jgi:hypothetical protein
MPNNQYYIKILITIICVLNVSSKLFSQIKNDANIFDFNADIVNNFIRDDSTYLIEAFAATSNRKILEV